MSEIKSINKVNIRGTEVLASFNLTWPVGVTYTQYPGQKSPMDLWGDFSTWEVVKYGGAFFRTEGGNAKEWLEPLPATTADGLEFVVDLSLLPSEEERNKMKKTSNFNVGDVVAIGGEQRVVTAVADTAGNWNMSPSTAAAWLSIVGFKVGSAFPAPFESITNAVVLQNDGFKNHNHNVYVRDKGHTHGINNSDYFLSNSYLGSWAATYGTSGNDFVIPSISIKEDKAVIEVKPESNWTGDPNVTSKSGINETRTLNSSFRIWKRID